MCAIGIFVAEEDPTIKAQIWWLPGFDMVLDRQIDKEWDAKPDPHFSRKGT